ncbi:10804_t:CDS:10 [Funneliformis geosporum]|uniref:Phosphodiesterase n=1 Tax=Funneliformis geosporum TaxID=1117311 RepID=A0A9W4SQH1_9GLOM|nr:10804_t:CDS:10 [Funneliformis geosporum]
MEPSRCSVLVVDRSCIEQTYQPSDTVNLCSTKSFIAPSGDRCTCEVNNNQDIDALIKIFLTIFAEVVTVPSGTKALSALRKRKVGCPPTILLIDIDHTESISRDTFARRESFLAMTDGVSLAEIHTTKDTLYGLELLKYITFEISRGALEQVIPIVCSFNENSEFMLDCLKKGAVDYLLKPIGPETSNNNNKIRLSSAAELERTNHLKKILTVWEFDSHNLSEEDLLRCVVIIFEHAMELDEIKELNVSTAIRQAYHDSNPYHNFTHAVDVLQAMFYFLCEMDLIPNFFSVGYKRRGNSCNQQRYRPNDLLRDSDVFALLLASIGHDVGHPGVNNGFLVNTRTPLAQIYNDKSVLENFHAMTLFNLMQKYGFKIYDKCLKYSEFRKVVVNAILATDMQLHNNYVKDIKGQRLRFESPNFELSKVEEEKSIIVGALIKCADISNTARPYHIAESWSNVLLQECSCQGDLERKLGIPVGPLNDRNTSQPDSQIDFINACAMPLFKSISELIPEMNFTVSFLESNRKTWSDKKKNSGTDNRSRHNSSDNDSGVIVSLDSRQNSPIVAVPAARIMQHQSSLSYLRPMPSLSDGPGSEAHSDVLSTAGASDAPIIQQTGGHSRRRSITATMKQALAYYAVTFNNRSFVKRVLLKFREDDKISQPKKTCISKQSYAKKKDDDDSDQDSDEKSD